MRHEDLFIPGTELSELHFDNCWDWFIHVTDIRIHWKNEPTYLLSQFAYLVGGVVTLTHALVRGGRLPYLWLAVIIHGLVVESICYIHPDVDNFWHSQTPIIFLGRRLPLHIIFLYPCFIYQATIGAAKMRLPKWSEPFAVGLLVVLIDIPYDIVSVKFLHWTWHDTDPNIEDRHYWVPWNSYYFHATFAAGFTFWFHFIKEKLGSSKGKWEADGIFKELLCSLLAGLLGAPTGILVFIPIYHPLHDIYNIHSEVTFFIIFAVFLLLIWSGDRQRTTEHSKGTHQTHWTTWLALGHLVLHYATFLAITVFFNPENEVSTGMKEPLGPCEEYVPLHTALGMTITKRKYLCPTDYNEDYFDWSCLPDKKHPSLGSIWYTTCGVPFSNRAEYIVLTSLVCLIAAVVFREIHFKSSGEVVFEGKRANVNKKNK